MESKTVNLPITENLVSAVMSSIGSKGGKSKSSKKMAAMRKNIKLAWKARRKKAA